MKASTLKDELRGIKFSQPLNEDDYVSILTVYAVAAEDRWTETQATVDVLLEEHQHHIREVEASFGVAPLKSYDPRPIDLDVTRQAMLGIRAVIQRLSALYADEARDFRRMLK